MTSNKSMFSSHRTSHNSYVELGNNKTVKVLVTGTVEMPISVNEISVKCMLKNVLNVPELGSLLLSAPAFDKSGLTTAYHSKRCWISNGPKLLAIATMKGNLYKIGLHSVSETTLLANTAKLWHVFSPYLYSWDVSVI